MTLINTQQSAVTLTDQHIAQTYGRPNFVLSHGEGMTVWDTDGKAYLDLVSGIAVMSLGHSDPDIAQVIQEQATKLVHVSNLYYTQPQAELAQLLCEKSFADRAFFCNSGAEAVEACIKFARKKAYGQPEKTEIIAFENAFHGRTAGALSVTPRAKYQDPFRPLLPDVTILPFNDIEAVQNTISSKTAAVIVEPIQGEGGIHPANAEFLQALRDLCDANDAVLIFDEVQCGVGRTGTLWAHESSGVTPDLMALAKPLASGLPIGVALMTEDVHSVVVAGDHGSTFAGGNLVTAVATHVLQRLSAPEMLTHVQEISDYLIKALEAIESPHIQTIRGKGLMLGIELDFPATEVVNAGYEAGFLLVNAGPNVLRLVPPLIIETEHVDQFIAFFKSFLADYQN